VGAAMGVDAADDHPSALPGALGHPDVAFRSRHEPGPARTTREGGHTSDKAWSHKLVSGHTSPYGQGGGSGSGHGRQDHSYDQGTDPSSLGVQWANVGVELPTWWPTRSRRSFRCPGKAPTGSATSTGCTSRSFTWRSREFVRTESCAGPSRVLCSLRRPAICVGQDLDGTCSGLRRWPNRLCPGGPGQRLV